MKTRISYLREDRSSTILDELMNEEDFLSFTVQIRKTWKTMSQMSISFINEVGNLLAIN